LLFRPVSDALAVRQLLFPLLAAALLVPYFKRSTRVKKPSSTRNNLTVNLLSPVVVYPIMGGFFISG
jgi:hypothetical protein